MYEFTKFYIDGQWVKPTSSETLEVINPSDETVIGHIAMGNETDVEMAVSAASRAFSNYSKTTLTERVELLEQLIATYEKYSSKIAQAISDEMGAPMQVASTAQAPIGKIHLQKTLEALKAFKFEETIGHSRILHEPIGVCALITPWNWPMNQLVCKVAPALATGCTMVLKPSEIAPLSAYLFAQVCEEAGVPDGVFNLINGDGINVGEPLARHTAVDMVSFTGSTRAGTAVSKAAADTIKRVSLELGGKSANVILDDADIKKAVTAGVMSIMYNSGQSCNAPTRMLVPRERLDTVNEIALQAASRVVVGRASEPESYMGPVVSDLQYDRIQAMIQAGIDEGATLLTGGLGKPEGLETGYYVKPTIFTDVSSHHRIAQEEIFGPVLVIIPYEDEEQALQIANDSPYGLSGYVSSGDIERARQFARGMRTGMVHLNNASTDAAAPFGGYKQSGNGREWGVYGLEEFLEVKAVME